jgi:hypothetical protein
MVKGKAEPVQIFRPAKKEQKSLLWDRLRQSVKAEKKIVGRQIELEAISQVINKGEGGIVIVGEPGVGMRGKGVILNFFLTGKTVLLDHTQAQARQNEIPFFRSVADSIEKNTPFQVWKPIFSQVFGLHKMRHKTKEQRRDHVLQMLASNSEITEWAPLLNDVLLIDIPPTSSTTGLSPEDRRAITCELLVRCYCTYC